MATFPGSEWPLVTAEAMRGLDRHTIEKLGVPGELLMECAGRLVAALAEAELAAGGRVHLLCGPGNNGGDGLVAARHLHLRGVPATVVLAADPARVRGDAARNLERAKRAGVVFAGPRWRAEPGDVLVDALFGTGLARALEGEAAAAVKRLLAARPACRVLAVDLPSGLDADTGQPLGPCVHADVTVTLGLPKRGLAQEPGRSLAGRVVVGRIGIADAAPGVAITSGLLTRRGAGALLPERPSGGHKGSFGHVLVAAGSRGKAGAAALAALAASRVGAGLVTVACPEGVNAILQATRSEAMTAPLPESPEGELAAEAAEPLLALARARDVLALGPGLGRGAAPRELVRRVVPRTPVPLVLDADGLVAFAGEPEALRACGAPAVLTPHPGEAALLLGSDAAEINRDRVAAALRLAERSGAVVLLKGAATVVADPGGRVRINPTGGPVLAAGGTGDVLTGVVAGLLAQGLAPFEAASAGSFLHGAAGDRLALALGPAGVLAGELAGELPAAAEALREAARGPAGVSGPSPGGVDALAFPEP
jgi:NAD(P)H-hydrate epimerase